MRRKSLSFFALFLCLTIPLSAEVRMLIRPAASQENVFHLAEGTPAVLTWRAWAQEGKTPRSGVLTVDLPKEIELVGSGYTFNRSAEGVKQDKIRRQEIVRDGQAYTRFEVNLSRAFLASAARSWSWEYGTIFLLASKDSANKDLTLYSSVRLDGESSGETVIRLTVMPPLKKPSKAAKLFTLDLYHMAAMFGTAPPLLRETLLDLWRGITETPVGYAARPAYLSTMKEPPAGYEGIWTLPTFGSVPSFDTRSYISLKPYPAIKNGTPSPVWLADDPEKKLEEYIRWGLRFYRTQMPHIRRLFWNIEPTQDKFGEPDLQAFAKKMELEEGLSADEMIRRYPDQWRRFRVETTMRIVRKVTDIMKQDFPEMEIGLCGIPLEKRYPDGFNPNSAIDLRIADKFPGVDVHLPMQYYSGVELFDDVELTLKQIRKPLIGLQDITEDSFHWYSRYNAPRILQNIVLYALLGAKGYQCYPTDNFDHRYIQAIYDAYGIIACAEHIWRRGKDITGSCRVEIVSEVPVQFQSADGTWNSAVLDSGADFLRSRIHRLDKETAVTLFNFDPKRTAFVRVTVPGVAPDASLVLTPDTSLAADGKTVKGEALASGLLLKLPPNSVQVLIAGGTESPQETREIAGYEGELSELLASVKKEASGQYTAQTAGDFASDWTLMDGRLRLRLIAGEDRAVSFDIRSASPVSWRNPMRWGDPCIVRHTAEYLRNSKKNGFAGTIEIISSGSRRKICDFTLDSVRTSATANEAVFTSEVPRYQGIEQWNDPLEGLLVTSAWSQSEDGLHLTQTVTLKNLNPRKETMKGALLVRNYAFIHNGELLAEMPDGLHSFNDASAALLKKDAVLPFSAKTSNHPGWLGGKVFVIAPANGNRRGFFACAPDPACSGVYSWSDFTGGRTAEFFTSDFLLDWNGEKTFTFEYEVGLAPAGFPEQACKRAEGELYSPAVVSPAGKTERNRKDEK